MLCLYATWNLSLLEGKATVVNLRKLFPTVAVPVSSSLLEEKMFMVEVLGMITRFPDCVYAQKGSLTVLCPISSGCSMNSLPCLDLSAHSLAFLTFLAHFASSHCLMVSYFV